MKKGSLARCVALLCMLVTPFFANAQNWILKGIESDNQTKTFSSVKIDGTGNTYVAGGFAGTLCFQPTTLTTVNYNAYIAKLDVNNDPVWALQCTGNECEIIGTDIDATGTYLYAIGYYSGSMTAGSTTLTSVGGYDVFILKVDAVNGQFIDAQSYGSTGFDYGTSIVCKNNMLYATGVFSFSVSFGATTLTSVGGADAFVLKFDLALAPQWASSWGGANEDYGMNVTADANGSIYVSGDYDSPTIAFASATIANNGSTDIFLVKFDALGTEVWGAHAGTPNTDYSDDVVIRGSDVCISGTYGQGNIVFGQYGLPDQGFTYTVCVGVYNAQTGADMQILQVAGCADAFAGGMTSAATGELFVAGYFTGTSFIGQANNCTSAGQRDAFVVRYNASYVTTYASNFGGADSEIPTAMCVSPSSSTVVMLGNFNGATTTFGASSITNTDGAPDGFVAKTSLPVGVAEVVQPALNITMYPNPCTDRFTVDQPDGTEYDVVLNDVTGAEVKRVHAIGRTEIMCEELAAGAYVVMVIGEEVRSGRLIKQ